MDEEDSYYQSQEIEVLKSIYEDSFSQIVGNNPNHSHSHHSHEDECCRKTTTTTTTTATTTTTTISTNNSGSESSSLTSSDDELENTNRYNIKININLPNEYKIIVQDDQDSSKFIKYSVICLPSINLSFEYPSDYPSRSPPKLYISSCWLTLGEMKQVLDHLKNDWEKGDLVIFKYVDWIKSSLITFLNKLDGLHLTNDPFDFDELIGSQDEDQQDEDEEDQVTWDYEDGWQSLLSSLPTLRSYNSHQGKTLFLNSCHTCSICDCESSGSEFTLLSTCSHFTCNDCIGSIVGINLKSGEFASIKCPNIDRDGIACNQPIELSIISKIISCLPPSSENDEMFKKYQAYLKQSKGLVKCIKCTDGWCYADRITNSTFCSTCYYSFCLLCRNTFHPGESCTGRETSDLAANRNNGGPSNIGLIKICSVCGALLSKIDGCNKVCCAACKCYLCWICLKPNINYDHFGTKCELFQINGSGNGGGRRHRGGAHWIQRTGVVEATTICKCKNLLHRYNNSNIVFCGHCGIGGKQYCFLCKIPIKGTSHFMKSNCSQNGQPTGWKPDHTYKFYDQDANPLAAEPAKKTPNFYQFDGIIVKR